MHITTFNKKIAILVTIMFMFGVAASAQPEENGGDPPVDAPFDGGISLLIAAGVGYGIRRVAASNKNLKSRDKMP